MQLDDAAQTPPAAVLKRAVEDRYRIDGELGAGGMATVYRAHDIKHNRRVAIKMLHPELSALLGAERFLSEIRTTAALQHPHILPLFDSGVVDGLLYYVMPLVEGDTLRERLTRETQLPVAEAVRIAVQIAGALDYAHRHGVIHRDIKPENILLHEGNAMVADFGIALAVEHAGGQRVTQTGLSLGTPRYMSPEQAMGEKAITARSDVYALGVVTYEMLTGEPPFTGSSAQIIVARVLTEEPRGIVAQRKHVPVAVEATVLTALEKLPADRFASADEFALALKDAALTGTGPVRAVTGSARRSPRLAVVGVVATAAVGCALLVWGWMRLQSVPPTVLRFAIPLPRNVSAASDQLPGSNITISPDGEVVVFAGHDADGTRWLYVRSLNDLTPHVLAGTRGAAQPFFSPDGRWLGFWSEGQMRKLGIEGGVSQPVAAMPAYIGASWTTDETIVYSDAGVLYTIPSAGGERTLIARPDTAQGETHRVDPVALPDGDHVLYMSAGASGVGNLRIGIVSLSTRSSRLLDVVGTYPLGVLSGRLIYASRDNTLQAVSFDASAGRVSGSPTVVQTDVDLGPRGAAKAALSASGTLVYRGGGRESRVVLADGRGAVQPVLSEARAYLYPRFSPDGQRIALTIDAGIRSDVWVYDQQSKTSTRLTSTGLTNDRAEWSPDGARVLYRTDASKNGSIWWRPADLSGPAVPLLLQPGTNIFEGVITPDNRSIVYQVNTSGSEIWSRSLSGDTTPHAIAAITRGGSQARVSPNGRWVAFVSSESGAAQVFVQPFPGPGAAVQVSQHGGSEPVWARDGRRIVYRGNKKFVAASVTAGATFSVSSRTVLFDDSFVLAVAPHANYDVSLDGARLLVLEAVEDRQLILVRNWGVEVAARVRARAPQ